jgi:hypothetical protein
MVSSLPIVPMMSPEKVISNIGTNYEKYNDAGITTIQNEMSIKFIK